MAEAVHESLCGRLWENDLIALFLVDQFTVKTSFVSTLFLEYTAEWPTKT